MQDRRVALVTGAGQGIGRAIAEKLGALSHHVVVIDRNATMLDEVAHALADMGFSVSPLLADVTEAASVQAAIDSVAARFGRIDILINNAGVSPSHGGLSLPIEEIPLDEWNLVLGVNLTGTFLMCRAALPLMKRGNWGRIVNFSSQGGRMRSLLSGAHYAATKAGIIGFTRILAGQVGSFGITANCIAPGRIVTPQSESFGDKDNYTANIPVGRFGATEDIAAGVEYLVSDGGAFVTGTVLDINGGFFMP